MKKIIYLFLISAAFLFQGTILDSFKVFSIKPDILLIFALAAGFYFDWGWALFFSLLCGVLKDALGANAVGINCLLFPLWSFSIVELSKKVTLDNNFICAGLIFIISVLNNILIRFLFAWLGRDIYPGIFLRITFLESFYSALTWLIIFKINVKLGYEFR